MSDDVHTRNLLELLELQRRAPACDLCGLRHRETCLEYALYLLAVEQDRPPNPGVTVCR